MFVAFLIPPLVTWTALGFPTDKAAIGILVAALLSASFAFIKEILGGQPSPNPAPASTTATTKTVNATPAAVFKLKRRLMFLQLRK